MPATPAPPPLEIAARMDDLNVVWKREAEEKGRKYVHVAVGVGINTGDCCVGNLGSSQRFDYSAIGDDVNVASRLEGLSKQYGVTIVIGESTAAQVKDPLLELDLIKVKGRTAPSRLYTMTAALGGSEESHGESSCRFTPRCSPPIAIARGSGPRR